MCMEIHVLKNMGSKSQYNKRIIETEDCMKQREDYVSFTFLDWIEPT